MEPSSSSNVKETVQSLIGFLGLIGVVVLVLMYRLSYLPWMQVTSDSLSPFVAGLRFLEYGFFEPANPESDQWLWILSLPLIVVSESLQDVLWWKIVASTLPIPIVMWIFYRERPFVQRWKSIWFVSALAGILALDMGLVDTMLSSFRGYWAPECMTLVCLGLWQWDRGREWAAHWVTVWTIIAMGQHPLVLGCILPLLWMWREMALRRQRWLISIGLALLCSLPRMGWLWTVGQCDAGGLACFTDIASSSAESISSIDMMLRVLSDRLWVEMGALGSLCMLIGWRYARWHSLQIWVIFAVIGITSLGLGISTLRPYHYRVLIYPMFLLSMNGLSRLHWKGLFLSALWVCSACFMQIAPVAWYNQAEVQDEMAAFLCTQEPVWLEGFGEDLVVSPQGVGLSMVLQGCAENVLSTPSKSLKGTFLIHVTEQKSLGHPLWNNTAYQIDNVSLEEMKRLDRSQIWSGYDAAILVHDPSSVVLEW